MSARTLKAKGFTLVEILIVVVILGILAAIVIPQFTSASEAAKASSVVTQLQTLRSQIELYQIQHNGDHPTLANFWDQMTEETNVDGSTTIATGEQTYGPYLQKESINPFEDSSALLAAGAADSGWQYDEDTGEIKAIIELQKAIDTNLVDSDATAGDSDPDFFTYSE